MDLLTFIYALTSTYYILAVVRNRAKKMAIFRFTPLTGFSWLIPATQNRGQRAFDTNLRIASVLVLPTII